MSQKRGFNTLAIHGSLGFDFNFNPVMPPIYLTSTYKQVEPGVYPHRYDYGRTGNPTRSVLEKALACLESGLYSAVYSSGCSAVATVFMTLSAGDHVILSDDVYSGTLRLIRDVFSRFGVEYTRVNLRHLEKLKSAIRSNTKMIFFETPSNPLLKVLDIVEISKLAKDHGLLVIVDNTFATPYLQRPLELGADVVVHSSTKYLSGHSDVIGGALVTNNRELHEKFLFLQNAVGAIPSPFDCFILLRSIKTLGPRMEAHCENAEKLVDYLLSNSKVKRVFYPGLNDEVLAKRQMLRFGGMISFELECSGEEVRKFLSALKIFTIAESLGGVESLIEVPAIMTHGYLTPEERGELGISETLIRVSVGLEDVEDLIKDFEIGFAAISS